MNLQAKKLFITIFSIVLFIVLFLVIGILNVHNYQDRTISQSKIVLVEYFEKRNEILKDLINPDYSLGMIEINAITDKDTYYVVVHDMIPIWITFTALNLFISPRIEIGRITQRIF